MFRALVFICSVFGFCRLGQAELNLSIDLGSAGPNQVRMSFELQSQVLNSDTAKASAFKYLGYASSPVEIISSTPGHRQVTSPSGLFDLQDVVSSGTYQYTDLTFYHGTGTMNGGYYTGSNSYKTIRFSYALVSGTNQLDVVEVDSSGTNESLYQFDGSSNWTFVSDHGQRKENQTQTSISGTRVVTTETRDGNDALVSKVQETYVTYAFGERLVKSVRDPDGEALTSTYLYQTSSTANGYGSIVETKGESGYWERYAYDAEGRTIKIVAQYLDAPDTAGDSQSRVRTTSYSGQDTTEVDTLLGVEIGRRYTVWSGSGANQTQRIESCATSGASIGASDSLVATTVYNATGQTTTFPHGTVQKVSTGTLSGGGMVTTTEFGQTSGTSIVAGSRNVLQQDGAGNLIQSQTYDLASGLLIKQATAQETDSFGRPTRISYLNGTSRSFAYGCCGLDQEIDAFGQTITYSHDAFGNVNAINQNGITVTSTFDPIGHLLRRYRVGTDGSSILIEGADYALSGWPTAIYSQSGTSTVSTSSGTSGVLTQSMTLPGGGTVINKTYPDGRALQVAGSAVLPRDYEYGVDGANGEFIEQIKVGNGGSASEWQKVFFDMLRRPWKTSFSDGNASFSYWNNLGQLVRSVDPDGVTTLYTYNSLGEQEYVAIDANGNSSIDFSGTDQVGRVVKSFTTVNSQTVQRLIYSRWGASGEITSAQSDTSLTSLDTWSNSFGLTDHYAVSLSGGGNYTTSDALNSGQIATSTYQRGRLVSVLVTGSGGIQAGSEALTYDPHGRIASDTRDGLATVAYRYNDADLITLVRQGTDSLSYEYDVLGNPIKLVRNGGAETDYSYYPTGLLQSVSGAFTYPVSYTYDTQGRLKTLTTTGQAGSATTTWNYDSQRGWLTSKRNAAGKGPDYTYTAAGRVATRQWARTIGGSRVQATYSYNSLGGLSGISYNDGTPSLTYAYDRLGRSTSITQGSTNFGYSLDDAGNLLEEGISGGDLDGLKVDFQYDAINRLTKISPVASSSTSAVYGYDGASRLLNVVTGSAEADYQYATGASRIEAVQFKDGGAQTGQTLRSFDAKGRLNTIATVVGSGTVSSHTYTYNGLDQRIQATLEDGSRWMYQYDTVGELSSGEKRDSSNLLFPGRSFSYAYDSIGNRVTSASDGRTVSYSANSINEYTSREAPGVVGISGEAAANATVTINGAESLRLGKYFYVGLSVSGTAATQTSFTVSSVLNQSGTSGQDLISEQTGSVFSPATPESFTYDNDGNLLSDGHYNYTWDGENRLIALEAISTVPESARKKAAYTYDPAGRRIQKQTWLWNSGSTAYITQDHLRFLYAGWNLAAEIDTSGTIVKSHTWGADLSNSLQGAGGVGGLLFTANSGTNSGRSFPAYDGNGNVMAMISSAGGVTQARFEYDPFGRELRSSGSGADSASFKFSSKYFDSESGLSDFGFRYYSPSQGRWISRDSLGEAGGLNLYGYVANAPPNYVDFLGFFRAPSGSPLDLSKVRISLPPAEPAPLTPVVGASVAETSAVVTGGSIIVGAVAAFEFGYHIGSEIFENTPVYGTDGSVTDWYANQIFSALYGSPTEIQQPLEVQRGFILNPDDWDPGALSNFFKLLGENPDAAQAMLNAMRNANGDKNKDRLCIAGLGQASSSGPADPANPNSADPSVSDPDGVNSSLALPAPPGFLNVNGIRDLASRIPDTATRLPWRDVPGGAEQGIKWKWTDSDGNKWQLRAHSLDPSAPSGSNAGSGWIYRVEINPAKTGGKWYMDEDGTFWKENTLNSNSPFFNPEAADATHIPFAPR